MVKSTIKLSPLFKATVTLLVICMPLWGVDEDARELRRVHLLEQRRRAQEELWNAYVTDFRTNHQRTKIFDSPDFQEAKVQLKVKAGAHADKITFEHPLTGLLIFKLSLQALQKFPQTKAVSAEDLEIIHLHFLKIGMMLQSNMNDFKWVAHDLKDISIEEIQSAMKNIGEYKKLSVLGNITDQLKEANHEMDRLKERIRLKLATAEERGQLGEVSKQRSLLEKENKSFAEILPNLRANRKILLYGCIPWRQLEAIGYFVNRQGVLYEDQNKRIFEKAVPDIVSDIQELIRRVDQLIEFELEGLIGNQTQNAVLVLEDRALPSQIYKLGQHFID